MIGYSVCSGKSLLYKQVKWGYFSNCLQILNSNLDTDGSKAFIQPMRLISASIDKSMMIWSPEATTGVWVNEVRMGDIGGSTYLGFCGALFSPDGKHIVSHGANGSFHLWKDNSEVKGENNWSPKVAISGHFKSVESLAWDPKSRYLLSAR